MWHLDVVVRKGKKGAEVRMEKKNNNNNENKEKKFSSIDISVIK